MHFRKTGRLEHQGIKIEFIGLIELYYDRGNHHEFLSLVSSNFKSDSSLIEDCILIKNIGAVQS